jgi:hypothetical protein
VSEESMSYSRYIREDNCLIFASVDTVPLGMPNPIEELNQLEDKLAKLNELISDQTCELIDCRKKVLKYKTLFKELRKNLTKLVMTAL